MKIVGRIDIEKFRVVSEHIRGMWYILYKAE